MNASAQTSQDSLVSPWTAPRSIPITAVTPFEVVRLGSTMMRGEGAGLFALTLVAQRFLRPGLGGSTDELRPVVVCSALSSLLSLCDVRARSRRLTVFEHINRGP